MYSLSPPNLEASPNSRVINDFFLHQPCIVNYVFQTAAAAAGLGFLPDDHCLLKLCLNSLHLTSHKCTPTPVVANWSPLGGVRSYLQCAPLDTNYHPESGALPDMLPSPLQPLPPPHATAPALAHRLRWYILRYFSLSRHSPTLSLPKIHATGHTPIPVPLRTPAPECITSGGSISVWPALQLANTAYPTVFIIADMKNQKAACPSHTLQAGIQMLRCPSTPKSHGGSSCRLAW